MENEKKLSNSAWWNTHISEKNTEWLEENVKGVDHCVKEMLLLIEQDGDISEDKVEINHLNQPGLIAHLKEISNSYHMLADHYIKLTGDLQIHGQSASEMLNYFGSQQNPSFFTPEKKLQMNNVDSQVVSSNISQSSGGGISDASFVADSGSSFSSDSDSESFNSSPNERLSSPSRKALKHKNRNMGALIKNEDAYDTVKVGNREDCEALQRRISEFEEELKISNEKLKFAEEKIFKLKSELENNEAIIVKMGNVEVELLSAKNQIKLHEDQIDMENKKSLLLQRDIVELEAELESEKSQVLELQESVKKYTSELSNRDLEIKKLCVELQDASGNFALEKWQLESCISKLTERVTFHVAKNEKLQLEFEALGQELKEFETGKVEMEKEQQAQEIKWQNDFECMKGELRKKNELIDTLNKNLDALKLKYDMRMAEKDDVNARLQTLSAEISSHDNQIQFLEYRLRELLSENKQLSAESESAYKQKAQLKSRIDDLEDVISERGEEKREAIRQLCFSVDHYKTSYEELRSKYVIRKQANSCSAGNIILAS